MGYFILEAALFVFGLTAVLVGYIPLTPRRRVRGSAARIVGALLMVPLPLFLVACKQSGVPPLRVGSGESLDPFMPVTEGFVQLVAVGAALASVFVATVLTCVASETRRREDTSAVPGSQSKH